MKVVPSTLSGVLNDLPRYVKENEDVMRSEERRVGKECL